MRINEETRTIVERPVYVVNTGYIPETTKHIDADKRG